ncbi:MAG: metallophosphoesterase [Microbacteriaceae bacterium]
MLARRVVTGALALGTGVFAYASLIERNAYRVRRESLDVLEPGAAPITVLHLSDLHLAPWQTRKIEWVRALADVNPDLVVATGDMLGHVDALPALRSALAAFASTPGVYVHGSNDYFGPSMPNPFEYLWKPSSDREHGEPLDTPRLEDLYTTLGWMNLNNSSGRMTVKGSALLVIGTDDAHLGLERFDDVARAVDQTLEDSTVPIDAVIGVTHAPYRRVLNFLTTLGADAIFAGHTHGGQVCVPGIGALTTNSDLPVSLAKGISVWNHQGRSAYLNVSAGIGTSIYAPVRFACPPEAVLVTLRARDFGYS